MPVESHSDPGVLKIGSILHFSSAFGLEIFTSNTTFLLKAPSLLRRKVMHYSEGWKTTSKKKNHMQILFESATHIYYLPTVKSDPRDICHMWLLSCLVNIKSKPLKLSCTFFSSTKLTFLCWRVNKWQDQTASGINIYVFFEKATLILPAQCILIFSFLFTSGINNITVSKNTIRNWICWIIHHVTIFLFIHFENY